MRECSLTNKNHNASRIRENLVSIFLSKSKRRFDSQAEKKHQNDLYSSKLYDETPRCEGLKQSEQWSRHSESFAQLRRVSIMDTQTCHSNLD